MTELSRYWTLVRLDRLGRCQRQTLQAARMLMEQRFAPDERERRIQRQLVDWWQYPSAAAPEMTAVAKDCLRCAISNFMEAACRDLAQQFGTKYDFTAAELLPLVLDAQAEPELESRCDSPLGRLSQRILTHFDPRKSSLSTWTKHLVKRDSHVHHFLLERGMVLVTDWWLLSNRRPAKLARLLSEIYQQTPAEVDRAVQLLERFHQVYYAQLLQRRAEGSGGGTYPLPTTEQLCQIANGLPDDPLPAPEQLLADLQALAQKLRADYIYRRVGTVPTVALVGDVAAVGAVGAGEAAGVGEVGEMEEGLAVLLEDFRGECLARAVAQTTAARVAYLDRRKRPQTTRFLRALQLFHCEALPMGEIARHLEFKAQSQVSRLLELKEFRADVGRRVLACLCDRIRPLAQQRRNPDSLEQLDRQLAEALEPQVTEIVRSAEKSATTRRDRASQSQFADAVCEYLTRRERP